jgi:hypothetical protein
LGFEQNRAFFCFRHCFYYPLPVSLFQGAIFNFFIRRAFGNSFSRRMNSAADTKNLLQTGSNASENVFLTRFPYQAEIHLQTSNYRMLSSVFIRERPKILVGKSYCAACCAPFAHAVDHAGEQSLWHKDHDDDQNEAKSDNLVLAGGRL